MQRNLIILLIGIILVAVFALQNAEPQSIQFFFWTIETTKSITLLLIFFFGAITGVLSSLPTIVRKNKHIKELEQKTHDSSQKDEPLESPLA